MEKAMPSGQLGGMPEGACLRGETQSQAKYFNYLLKSSVEVVLFIDRGGRVAYCTDAMLRLAGISDFSSIEGKPYQYLYAKFGGEALVRKGVIHYEQVKQTLRASSLEVFINFPGSGNNRVYSVNVAPMIDGGGAFDGAIVSHHDTTETRRVAADARGRELEVQMQAAQVASEAKSRFLASMSHEIRAPMNAIIGMSDLIRTDNLDMTQRTFFGDIKKMSKSLLQIINDVLDFSRIEAGKLEITPVHFNLLELFNNICSMCRFLAEAKGLYFYCSYGSDVPAVVYGDDVRVRQVVFNIINNAIKYTREGQVSFSVGRDDRDSGADSDGSDCVVFTIKDTGIGIKEDDLAKLFNAFYQVDMAVNHGIDGSGLGLSITKNLVSLMGGEIDVQSSYGEGSEFTVRLPLAEGDPGLVGGLAPAPLIRATDGARVLVVDDSQINLKVALAYLERHNIHAETALSGPEAIMKIQKAGRPYDLVFMDHMMPIMDGVETTHRIRALGFADLPIVALTANAIEGIRDLFLQSDMNDFLSKPIDPEKLNSALVRWLPPSLLVGGGAAAENGLAAASGGAVAVASGGAVAVAGGGAAAVVGSGAVAGGGVAAVVGGGAAAAVSSGAAAVTGGGAAAGDAFSQNPYINFTDGINNALGDRALYKRLLSDFLAEHGTDHRKIKDAIDASMFDDAKRFAHTLKGSASLIGANRLRQVAFSTETLLDEDETGKAAKTLHKLDQELTATFDTIEQLLPQFPT
ncbi:MAG: ATP-binding protein [Oscillospiraceae bacterium]|nr:ATP-binding protein [Oscillospiraceae bacterium]